MVVYPDLAFLVGFMVHGSVFWLSLFYLELRRPPWQILLCTVCSAGCSAVILIPSIPVVFPVIIGVLCCLLLFRGKTVLGFLRNLLSGGGVFLLYLGVWILLSGILFSLGVIVNEGNGYFSLSFLRTVCSGILAFFICRMLFRVRKRRLHISPPCLCEMELEGRTIPVLCYVDTGHFLRDPVGNLPVVIIEYSVLIKAFGASFPRPLTYEFSQRFFSRARVIPYRSVSGEGNILSAFVPHAFRVGGVNRSVVVAVTERPLESQGRFFGIISPELLEGEYGSCN